MITYVSVYTYIYTHGLSWVSLYIHSINHNYVYIYKQYICICIYIHMGYHGLLVHYLYIPLIIIMYYTVYIYICMYDYIWICIYINTHGFSCVTLYIHSINHIYVYIYIYICVGVVYISFGFRSIWLIYMCNIPSYIWCIYIYIQMQLCCFLKWTEDGKIE